LLSGALAAGADSAEARAGLAVVAARAKDWTRAAADARAALAAARGTLRHPYPREWLGDALTHVALEGPPRVADTLMRAAVAGVGSAGTAATPAERSSSRSNRTFCIASTHDSI